MPSSDMVAMNPIKLHWYIFSYGHINSRINWNTGNYDCIDGRDLVMQVLHYWAPVADSTIQLAESNVSLEKITDWFDSTVSRKIPIYKGQRHILAPIFISRSNEWHIAIVFLLDSGMESSGLYLRLKKLYVDDMKMAISNIRIAGRETIKFNKYELVPQQVWQIGAFKMRVHHILQGIIPYLPSIKIAHRSTLKLYDQFAKFTDSKYSLLFRIHLGRLC